MMCIFLLTRSHALRGNELAQSVANKALEFPSILLKLKGSLTYMPTLKYLSAYPQSVQEQAQTLIDQGQLSTYLSSKYPNHHHAYNDASLRDYVMELKNQYLKKSAPLSKVGYDSKIHVINNALGLHSYVSRVQGSKLCSKNEIRIATFFKKAPEPFLKMIVVHELAHLKQKDHNKAFYQLCQHMLPEYFQLEFDLRLYLTHLDF